MTTHVHEQLIRHEGSGPIRNGRLMPYLDCCGKYWRDCHCEKRGRLTIGYGRNIDDIGISKEEAGSNLDNDILRAQTAVIRELPWSVELDRPRFEVLVNMTFNMGIGGTLGFRKFLAELHDGHFEAAAKEMLDSRWAEQVGRRADELAQIVRTGEDPFGRSSGGAGGGS